MQTAKKNRFDEPHKILNLSPEEFMAVVEELVELGAAHVGPTAHGYYSLTTNDRCLMHRYVWEKEVGPIPKDWDIHHRNNDKSDNSLTNLICMPKSEHTRIHQILQKYDTHRPVRWDRGI